VARALHGSTGQENKMVQIPKYKQFISEFVRQQMTVLGPNLAVSTANRTVGLEVNHKGAALEITGDPALVLKTMLGEFSKLSPHLTNYFTRTFFVKYPDIAEEYGEPIPKINFVCALIKPKA
jgi:hypothetical protein